MYEDVDVWRSRQGKTESEWKEQYGSSLELIDTPTYLSKITDGMGASADRKGKVVERRKREGRG